MPTRLGTIPTFRRTLVLAETGRRTEVLLNGDSKNYREKLHDYCHREVPSVLKVHIWKRSHGANSVWGLVEDAPYSPGFRTWRS